MPSHATFPRTPTAEEAREYVARLRTDLAWLVRLRGFAAMGVVTAVLVVWRLGYIERPAPMLVVAGLMLAYDAALHFWQRRLEALTTSRFRVVVLAQLAADISALTLLLHYSGGVENPFAMLLVFHMAIGATLLDRDRAWFAGALAVLQYGGLLTAESLGIVAHHDLNIFHAGSPLQSPYRVPEYVLGQFTALTLALLGTIYFVRALAVRHRRVEARLEEHKRVAAARERMARIGELSAGVAHAIRNPLHGLLNCVDILRDGKCRRCNSSCDEMLELMTEGMQRIQTVTQRLLTLGSDAALDRRPADLAEVIGEACQYIQMRGRGREVHLHLELQRAPLVPVDRERLGEALLNIVDNALAACQPRGNVRVRLRPHGTPAELLHIEIEDDGCGIAPEALPLIFHPFYTSKAIGEGTGLGLSIARRVVEEHGGTIGVTSRLGAGTLVRIELPVPERPTLREATT